jgi:hypothetical protein
MASDQFTIACRASALPDGKLVGDLVRCLLDLLVHDVHMKLVKWDGQSSASEWLRVVALIPDKFCAQCVYVWYSDVSTH